MRRRTETRGRASTVTRRALRVLLAAGAVGAALPASAQAPASLLGRVFDEASGEGVADAAVLVEGTGLGTVTNDAGLFRFPVLPAGEHVLHVQHLAYGDLRRSIRVRPGQDLTLRVTLTTTAIELDSLVVEGYRPEERAERARGTSRNVVTREQLEPFIATGQTLHQALVSEVTGVVVRNPGRQGSVCLEFRSPRSLQDPLGCKTPTVFLDGVRIISPQHLWDTFALEEVQRLEVVPAVEAGARYGTDSSHGVLIIETRTGSQALGVEQMASHERRTYDWALESEEYPWFRAFASSFVLNGLGLAAGSLIGQSCFEFQEGLANSHFFLETSCSGAATFGASVALFGLPVAGATFGANRGGRTDLSQGRWVPTAVASTLAVIPGYILVVANDDESFTGGSIIGWALLTVGVPAFATVADRLFREFRGDPFADLRR